MNSSETGSSADHSENERKPDPVAFINGRFVEGDDPIRQAIELATKKFLEDLANE